MRKRTAAVLICWMTAPVWADPPEIVRVIRNVRSESAGGLYADAGAAVNVLGMSTVSGIDPGWQVELHDSFASLETLDQAMAARHSSTDLGWHSDTVSDDVLGPARLVVAMYQPGLSYRADEAAKNLPKARYLLVTIYRVRPGNDASLAEIVKLRRARSDSINLERPEIAYEVITGATVGTYLFMAPLPALKMLDDGLNRTPPNYADGVAQTAKKVASETEFSQERLLLRLEPGMSYVSDEFAGGDPDFWRGK
jgi:hypothetical protein